MATRIFHVEWEYEAKDDMKEIRMYTHSAQFMAPDVEGAVVKARKFAKKSKLDKHMKCINCECVIHRVDG